MKISLIVSTYNWPQALELVLMAIRAQHFGPGLSASECEVLIADDGSGPATRALIERYQSNFPFPLTHVWHPDTGFRLAAIRNLAASKAQGEYLIFIDGDCLIAPDFLVQQAQLAEPGWFVGGNRVLLSARYTQQIFANKDITISRYGLLGGMWQRILGHSNKWLAGLRLNPKSAWRKRQAHNWRRPKGCNMAVWRSDLLKVNGFDESFVGWGHEDADFLVRLLHAGIQIKDGRFAAPVYHLWHKTNERTHAAENLRRLHERVAQPELTAAKLGISQYLTQT